MAYASTDDVNRWLDGDSIVVTSTDYLSEEDSAERIIRGALTGKVDGTTMNSWIDPLDTPEIVREIAGKLVAAFRYRKMLSADATDVEKTYGQLLYNEAMSTLNDVVEGKIVLVGIDPALVTSEGELLANN